MLRYHLMFIWMIVMTVILPLTGFVLAVGFNDNAWLALCLSFLFFMS